MNVNVWASSSSLFSKAMSSVKVNCESSNVAFVTFDELLPVMIALRTFLLAIFGITTLNL